MNANRVARARAVLRPVLRHPAFAALLLWAAFMATRKDVWGLLTRLSASTFEGFSILGRALLLLRQAITFVFALLALRVRWHELAHGRALRMIGVLVVAQAWVAALYEYNLLNRCVAGTQGGTPCYRDTGHSRVS